LFRKNVYFFHTNNIYTNTVYTNTTYTKTIYVFGLKRLSSLLTNLSNPINTLLNSQIGPRCQKLFREAFLRKCASAVRRVTTLPAVGMQLVAPVCASQSSFHSRIPRTSTSDPIFNLVCYCLLCLSGIRLLSCFRS